MKVLFSDISSAGVRYRLVDVTVPVAGREFQLQGPVGFSCTLAKKNGGGIILNGEVTASLLLSCDRCLCTFPFQVQSEVSLSFVVEDNECLQLRDIELPVVDLDVIELSEPVIDLEEIAVGHLDYNLPVKYLCDSGCRGICFACGVNLNRDDCSCLEDVENNPFSILAKLKK